MKYTKRKHVKRNIFWLLLIVVSNVLVAQQELFSKELFLHEGDTLKYRLLLPKNFDENKAYPLVLFLHGRGESGNDNETQLVHGSQLFLDNYESDAFPAIVIFPQCPKDDYWSNVKRDYSKTGLEKFKYKRRGRPTKAMQLVLDLMDDITKKPYVKKRPNLCWGPINGRHGCF